MKEDNTLRTFINSENAKELNAAFIKVLIGEKNGNLGDLNIPSSRWLYENHPIVDDDSWFEGSNDAISFGLVQGYVDGGNSEESFITRIKKYFKKKSGR